MNFYDEKGYVNIPKLWGLGYTYMFIIGGRGTGKTYGTLKFLYESGIKIMLARRTAHQSKIVSKDRYSPYKKINADLNANIHAFNMGDDMFYFADCELSEGKNVPAGEPIAYVAALSTVANIRGLDGSDIDALVVDEFIKKPREHTLPTEGQDFADLCETIGRNRELDGKQPLRCILLGNSNTLDSGILHYFNLIDVIEKMKRRGKTWWCSQHRSVCVLLLDDSPISMAKNDTALYRAIGEKYGEMALKNSFDELNAPDIRSRSLKNMIPLFSVSGAYVYQMKCSTRVYVSSHGSGDFDILSPLQAQRDYYFLYNYYIRGKIEFENFFVKNALTNAMKWSII